jgi:putative flippase GtrA
MRANRRINLEETLDRSLSAKLLRFAISGIFTTVLYFLLTTLTTYLLVINPALASGLAYVFCVVISYFLHSRFTFRTRRDTHAQIAKFLSVSLAGLVISTLVMRWAVDIQGLPYWIGALAVAVAIPIANFAFFSTWVFLYR